MDITLEQARVFEAVARTGTVQKAATDLHKAHSAVLYSLKTLESQLGVKLFDRSGYRNKISLEGEIVLKYCRQLLAVRRDLEGACASIKGGWEPSIKMVYDGIVDFNMMGDALFRLNEMKAPTEVKVLSAHLNEVESLFTEEDADIMVTILPLQSLSIPSFRLTPIRMHLVAHPQHALGAKRKAPWTATDLNRHTFIQIRTSPGPIGLSTEQMKFDSYFYVNDFTTKKAAIMKRLGFGWLPDYLVKSELKSGNLRLLKCEMDNTHSVHPRLYHRPDELIGKATRELLKFFRSQARDQ